MEGRGRRSATDWRTFQTEVAALFTQAHGWSARVEHPVRGSRIGVVRVDVLATYRPPTEAGFQPRGRGRDHGFPFTVVVECKFWKTPVPQEKLFALKTIVEDVGASLGVLVSEVGIQRGAVEYLAHPVNVVAMTIDQLRAVASGFPYANCTDCGRVALILFPADPFPKKSAERPVFCRDCYQKLRRF